jgi:hypothetical protein
MIGNANKETGDLPKDFELFDKFADALKTAISGAIGIGIAT